MKNKGSGNIGKSNIGNKNCGSMNYGNLNSGIGNSGDGNTGCRNIGVGNSGDGNTGDGNSGSYNVGDENSGRWNVGDKNFGYFNNKKPNIIMAFNKECDIKEWSNKTIPSFLYFKLTEFIEAGEMSEFEKRSYPDYEIVGGYLKKLSFKKAIQKSYDKARKEEDWEQQCRYLINLPNFDYDVFRDITGIDLEEDEYIKKINAMGEVLHELHNLTLEEMKSLSRILKNKLLNGLESLSYENTSSLVFSDEE